jgi:hypothetical protein
MTIALSLKVNDGVVLATDSASTLLAQQSNQPPVVVQVYNNANKVFNLRKGLPIGAITWGAGAIGKASTSTLIKDLRRRFSGDDTRRKDWHLDEQTYTIEGVALKLREFIFDDCYVPAFSAWASKPTLGFVVAGYSAGSDTAEEWRIDIDALGACTGPVLVRPKDQCGMTWNGDPEAISRLILGHSPGLAAVLEQKLGVPTAQIGPAMRAINESLQAQIVADSMPIQDAIDLAYFLVELTEKYSRYTPGAATVGGPIEVAAITRHEGYKWVQRKLYFTRDLNPDAEHEQS